MGIILSSNRIRNIEKENISRFGIGAKLLMERAGLSIATVIKNEFPECDTPILIVCGSGNNGADGLVVARILAESGYPVSVFIREGIKSELFLKNLDIINSISEDFGELVEFISDTSDILDEYDVIVDALFGTGINRPLEDEDVQLIELINALNATKISIDIPSGLNSTTGQIYNACVCSDITVSLGTYKTGQLIKVGPDYCGKIVVSDIGLWFKADKDKDYFFLEPEDLFSFHLFRKTTANKGTYGKTLVIAGSENIYGACYLAGKASLLSGAGLVKIITHEANKLSLNQDFPESMISTYKDRIDKTILLDNLNWADTIVIGPGIGLSDISYELVKETINSDCLHGKTLIIDADGINILSKSKEDISVLLQKAKDSLVNVVMTPHKKELARLMSAFKMQDEDEEEFCKNLFHDFNIHVINKDARTRIYGDSNYINMTGNDGMATAGSGDVLAGILGGLINRIDCDDYAKKLSLAVYVHGLCGDLAKENVGAVSMTAVDILNAIPKALDFLT